MPGFIFKQNYCVSKSGTLTLRSQAVKKQGLEYWYGNRYWWRPLLWNNHKEAVELLMHDPETEGIIMIGEIGGGMEAERSCTLD